MKYINFKGMNIKKIIIYVILISLVAISLSYHTAKGLGLKPVERDPLVNDDKKKLKTIPDKINIKMTFYPQAPYADWSLPYQEACEEASVLLTANLLNKMSLDRENFKNELLKLVEWEKEEFGDYLHTDIRQTEIIINKYFNLKTVIHKNPSLEEIALIISKGNPVVAPFAGKLLNNPYFSNGGPKYHMLVIKGYNLKTNEIITNDVGTRRGEDFIYSWECIQNALHDWNDEDMLAGEKLIIEVFP